MGRFTVTTTDGNQLSVMSDNMHASREKDGTVHLWEAGTESDYPWKFPPGDEANRVWYEISGLSP